MAILTNSNQQHNGMEGTKMFKLQIFSQSNEMEGRPWLHRIPETTKTTKPQKFLSG